MFGDQLFIKWGAITFGIGIVLAIAEIFIARRKKEGFLPSDRQRVTGIIGIFTFLTALVMFLVWTQQS